MESEANYRSIAPEQIAVQGHVIERRARDFNNLPNGGLVSDRCAPEIQVEIQFRHHANSEQDITKEIKINMLSIAK